MAKSRLRVLHVISDTNFGGAGRYLLTLLGRPEYLERVSLEVACPCPGLLWDRLVAQGVHTHALPAGDRSLDPGQLTPLFSIIAHGRYDIIHTHASLTARIVARLFPSLKIVFTKHTLGGAGSQGRMSAMLQRLLADRVICPSRATLEQLKAAGLPGSMLDLIYNGVDVDQIRTEVHKYREANAVPAVDASHPIVLSTGRLESEKGHEHLIRAMPAVIERHPGARLVLAGDGSLSLHLHAIVSDLGIAAHVEFPGFVEDVTALLARADVFVLPSLSEALGISLLEAMAAGVPVIGSNTGGIPEVVDADLDGILVEPGNPEQIARAVLRLLEDAEFARSCVAHAQAKVGAIFSAATQARGTIATYEKTVERSPRSKRSTK